VAVFSSCFFGIVSFRVLEGLVLWLCFFFVCILGGCVSHRVFWLCAFLVLAWGFFFWGRCRVFFFSFFGLFLLCFVGSWCRLHVVVWCCWFFYVAFAGPLDCFLLCALLWFLWVGGRIRGFPRCGTLVLSFFLLLDVLRSLSFFWFGFLGFGSLGSSVALLCLGLLVLWFGVGVVFVLGFGWFFGSYFYVLFWVVSGVRIFLFFQCVLCVLGFGLGGWLGSAPCVLFGASCALVLVFSVVLASLPCFGLILLYDLPGSWWLGVLTGAGWLIVALGCFGVVFFRLPVGCCFYLLVLVCVCCCSLAVAVWVCVFGVLSLQGFVAPSGFRCRCFGGWWFWCFFFLGAGGSFCARLAVGGCAGCDVLASLFCFRVVLW